MAKRESPKGPLALRVLRFIREHHLVSGERPLLVAVSGGPDSVCLLHVLVNLKDKLGIRLHVAHLNHQLRGAESDADARYVSDMASRLGIPATVAPRDVKAHQARHRISLEEAAREVRYRFLAEVARSIGTDQVAVGHTLDDHIETMLMHLVRGTGTRGLRGLQPSTGWQQNRLTIVRPLLGISRQEVADYCRNHSLKPRLDSSNLSLSPLRNRLRHQLLPLLESYNPQVTAALLRTARIAGDDLAFLDAECTRIWDKLARQQGDTIILDKAGVLNLPLALKRHLLRMAIERLLGTLKDIETRHIEEITAALTKPAGKRVSLPGGLVFAVEYDRYLMGPDEAALAPFPVLEGESALEIPGETRLPGWHVKAKVLDPSEVIGKPAVNDDFSAYLDLDKTGDKLSVRRRRPGDRFQPLGLDQPKKLGEFMIDARIPRPWRQRIPIACSPSQIVWVVGWRIDERAKVTGTTKQILELEFKPDI